MARWRAYRTLEWFIFIGLAMAGFFALVVVVVLMVTAQRTAVVVWPVVPSSTINLKPTSVSTGSWHTYRNAEWGFTLHYPKGFQIQQQVQQQTTFWSTDDYGNRKDEFSITYFPGRTVNQAVTELPGHLSYLFYGQQPVITGRRDVTMNGCNVVVVTLKLAAADSALGDVYLIGRNPGSIVLDHEIAPFGYRKQEAATMVNTVACG